MKIKKITLAILVIILLTGVMAMILNLTNPCWAYARQPVQDVPKQCLEVMLR